MDYGDFKDLARRTASDKILRDKAFNIAKIPKYDKYQSGLASMVYKFFDTKTVVSGVKVGLSRLRKFFAKLKTSPASFEKIPSFVCLVFKTENK